MVKKDTDYGDCWLYIKCDHAKIQKIQLKRCVLSVKSICGSQETPPKFAVTLQGPAGLSLSSLQRSLKGPPSTFIATNTQKCHLVEVDQLIKGMMNPNVLQC